MTAGSNDKKQMILNEHQTTPLPPLHDAPPELLSEIFILAIPTRKFVTDADSPVEEEFDHRVKFALSQVCRYWRAVALATPQIWSSIPVVSKDRLESKGPIAFTKLFIERSSNTPLHITIILQRPRVTVGTQEWNNITRPLLNLIFSHAYRWKSAIIHLHDDHSDDGCNEVVEIFRVLDLPILESLNYKHRSLIFFQFFIDIRNIRRAPSLRHVVLHGLQSQLNFPWAHPHTTDLTSIESASPQLRRCVLIGPLCLQWYPSTVMVFPQLTSLKIIEFHHTYERLIIPDGETVLRCISTPLLENLEIRTTSKLIEAPAIVAELHLTMLSYPSITLRSISFHVTGMTEEDLKILLYSTPCLVMLDICNTPASVFSCLYVGGTRTLTPRLQSLTIHDFSYSDVAALWAVYDSRHPTLNTAQDDTEIARLDIIFTYRSFRGCRQAQCRIAEGEGVSVGALRKTFSWCDHLVKQFLVEFPEKERKYAVLGNKKSSRHMYSPKELDVFFMGTIEAHQFSDPMIIELSRITRILSDIRDLPPTTILDDNDYEFRKRAGRVLDSLAPLLENLTSRRRWILGEDHLTLKACGPK